jgi:programmed cell death 8 (apoptosis-inducing factor)
VIEGDHVVVSVGIRPNNQLAVAAELEIDPKNGGIMVNQELQASRSNIYASGDVASYYDPVLGRRRVEHYDHAVMSGKFAARNMTGGKMPYLHQPFFWSDLGSVGYEVNFLGIFLTIILQAVGNVDANLRTVSVWEKPQNSTENPSEFKKGIVYYLNADNRVVGAIMWNLFGKVDDVSAVIRRARVVKDDGELKNLVSLEEVHH